MVATQTMISVCIINLKLYTCITLDVKILNPTYFTHMTHVDINTNVMDEQ